MSDTIRLQNGLVIVKPDYSILPEHIRGGVQRYVEFGVEPGGFLTSVIHNNLKESFLRADEMNQVRMFDIVRFFQNEAPGVCWGSRREMREWLKSFRKEEQQGD